jgi:hypothetical protein
MYPAIALTTVSLAALLLAEWRGVKGVEVVTKPLASLGFLLAAYIVAANSAGPGVVCAWDEPDNHLSLSQVSHFIVALRKMTNGGGQFIATTYHLETVRKFADDNTYVFSRKSHQEPTLVKRLTDIQYNGDLIHALMRDEVIG